MIQAFLLSKSTATFHNVGLDDFLIVATAEEVEQAAVLGVISRSNYSRMTGKCETIYERRLFLT
jgi:hypothetical protein